MRASCSFASTLGLLLLSGPFAAAQLPATPPTSQQTAPIAAIATPADRPGEPPHPARVTCASGQLTIRAENSSLNGILRAVSRCTGMTIAGGVQEQRVFGNYGPAAPATVLATLLDGTGSNMLLQETAANQPAHLILTPRTGGATPPAPSTYADTATPDTSSQSPAQPSTPRPLQRFANRPGLRPMSGSGFPAGSQTPTLPPITGSAVSTPSSIPQPNNNVTGSPSNTSPTASDYRSPDPSSVDSVDTPSTAPTPNGLVDAPNPPPPGSDTAAALNNTTPAATTTQTNANLTPEQIYLQLLQRQQQQQQQQTTPPQ